MKTAHNITQYKTPCISTMQSAIYHPLFSFPKIRFNSSIFSFTSGLSSTICITRFFLACYWQWITNLYQQRVRWYPNSNYWQWTVVCRKRCNNSARLCKTTQCFVHTHRKRWLPETGHHRFTWKRTGNYFYQWIRFIRFNLWQSTSFSTFLQFFRASFNYILK